MASRAAAGLEEGTAEAAKKAAAAKERQERLAKGEDVSGGLSKRWTQKEWDKALLDAGLLRCELTHEVCKLITVEEFSRQLNADRDRASISIARKILRKHEHDELLRELREMDENEREEVLRLADQMRAEKAARRHGRV